MAPPILPKPTNPTCSSEVVILSPPAAAIQRVNLLFPQEPYPAHTRPRRCPDQSSSDPLAARPSAYRHWRHRRFLPVSFCAGEGSHDPHNLGAPECDRQSGLGSPPWLCLQEERCP